MSYDCNTLVSYRLRGVHATLNVIWDWEAPEGAGDRHYAVYRGAKSSVEVRQTKGDRYQTEVYVIPNAGEDAAAIAGAIEARVAALQTIILASSRARTTPGSISPSPIDSATVTRRTSRV